MTENDPDPYLPPEEQDRPVLGGAAGLGDDDRAGARQQQQGD